MYVFIFLVKVTEWPPIGKIAAHSAYDMFHGISTWLLVWFFPTSVFWSGNLFLIAPFPDLCLLVPFPIFLWRRLYPWSWLSHSGVGQILIFGMQSVHMG